MFQQSAQRLAGLGNSTIEVAAPLIVTGEEHRFLASEQLREAGITLGVALLEPTGRNTAPALTLAALAAVQNGADPVLVVTPADQTVVDEDVGALSIEGLGVFSDCSVMLSQGAGLSLSITGGMGFVGRRSSNV